MNEQPSSNDSSAAVSGDTAAAASRPDRDSATCRCGHGVSHHMVSPDCLYSWWGWIRVSFLGISTRPTLVRYRCRACREILFETDEPAELDRHTYT